MLSLLSGVVVVPSHYQLDELDGDEVEYESVGEDQVPRQPVAGLAGVPCAQGS